MINATTLIAFAGRTVKRLPCDLDGLKSRQNEKAHARESVREILRTRENCTCHKEVVGRAFKHSGVLQHVAVVAVVHTAEVYIYLIIRNILNRLGIQRMVRVPQGFGVFSASQYQTLPGTGPLFDSAFRI